MTLNPKEAQRQNTELNHAAQKEQIREVLLSSRVPVTVAYIVKRTGFEAGVIRQRLYEMGLDGEARGVGWLYTV